MQDIPMSRWLSPLMAFCLSFIIMATLAPAMGIQIDRQIDFWLLWLGTMLLLALPVCYLEIALAKRSKTTALNALSSLTREADSSPKWRLAGWLAVIFIPFLAGNILSTAGNLLTAQLNNSVSGQIVFAGLAVVALILSFVPRQILIVLMTVGVIASLVLANTMGTTLQPWHWTNVEFKEWGNATVLALVASGLGLGLYWQNSLSVIHSQEGATKTALPIWLAQLIAVVAFGFFSLQAQLPVFTWIFTAVMTTALFIQLAKEQLAQRQLMYVLQWVVIILAVAVWAVPELHGIFTLILMLWGLLICLIYAIFAGWIMKISHLRKSMNFSNELFYNLWRIAVRIVLPLSIVIAMIAVIGQMI